MRWRMSCTRKSFTGFKESSLGVALKYNAPRRKFLVESVRKNWLAVATSPPTRKKHAVDIVWGGDGGIVNGRGHDGVFVGEVEGVVNELLEFILPDVFVADVYVAIELWEGEVYPPGVFGFVAKEGCVFCNFCIGGVFESVGIVDLVENKIIFLREVYFEITLGFWDVGAVAGKEEEDS